MLWSTAGPLLLALEPENFDPDTGERRQPYLYAIASKNYDLFTLTPTDPPELTLVKSSEHGLGHIRTPHQPDTDDRAWISQGRKHLLERSLGIPTREPHWWDAPSLSIVTLNRPGELARQNQYRRAGRLPLLTPFSRLVIAHPLPLYSRGGSSRRITPASPYHHGFDPHKARWYDLATGRPLTVRFTRTSLRGSDLAAVADRVLCDTVGANLEQNSRRPESKTLDHTGNPCGRDTIGLLQPAPTEAIRLMPIGKETRNLERAGITEDPTHTLYSDPDHDAWKQTILPTLRLLAPGITPRGRPSRHQRGQLAQRAGTLARSFLAANRAGIPIPNQAEQACYLYLTMLEQRTCACGCERPVAGRARYVNSSHRMRALRRRRADTASQHKTAHANRPGHLVP